MATVDVSVSSDLSPERAWELASNLSRFDEWLTIFGGWRSEVPEQVEVGTSVSSLIKVKGFRNVIHWRVTRYDEPKEIESKSSGKELEAGGSSKAKELAAGKDKEDDGEWEEVVVRRRKNQS